MNTLHYVHFSQPHLQFYCKECVSAGSGIIFNCRSSLSRISAKLSDLVSMRHQAETEMSLMQFYRVVLPHVRTIDQGGLAEHRVSVQVLHDRCRWLLDQYVPVDVQGDSNCLFRSVSLVLYGTEDAHCLLRLLCQIEVLCNRDFYDKESPTYNPPYKADHLLYHALNGYNKFVSDLSCIAKRLIIANSAPTVPSAVPSCRRAVVF